MPGLLKYSISVILALFLVGCVGSGTKVSPAQAQIEAGKPIYTQTCATRQCHGEDGEGLASGNTFSVWPSVGPEFQARNPSAQVIFDVVRSGSEPNLRALSDQQIYDAIAYEFSLNGIQPDKPLNAQNAAAASSTPAGSRPAWGKIYPPPGNAQLLNENTPPLPPTQESLRQQSAGYLGLRVDMLALASSIGQTTPANGGIFAIVVFAVEDLSEDDLTLSPKYLRLYDSGGDAHEAQNIGLAYPIESFHDQTIQPGHGTAGVAVFTLPAETAAVRLVYDDQSGHPLKINLQ